jgi:hypothetical protein
VARFAALVSEDGAGNSVAAVIAAAWFARQNHFEWMFNPLAQSAYAKADDASFVGAEDMVLAWSTTETPLLIRFA